MQESRRKPFLCRSPIQFRIWEAVAEVILRSDVLDPTEESDSSQQILQSLRFFRMTFCSFLDTLGPTSESLRLTGKNSDPTDASSVLPSDEH